MKIIYSMEGLNPNRLDVKLYGFNNIEPFSDKMVYPLEQCIVRMPNNDIFYRLYSSIIIDELVNMGYNINVEGVIDRSPGDLSLIKKTLSTKGTKLEYELNDSFSYYVALINEQISEFVIPKDNIVVNPDKFIKKYIKK